MSVRIVTAAKGIAEAVARLRDGQLVAFPTETVYGLGANALNAEAVARIYAAKGRPSTNPLIVHVPDSGAARALAADWTDAAETLSACFWPGPLTLVVEKAGEIPDGVTAGGSTVGLRVPRHPVALELLRLSGVPVAAPSANRSEEVSPTTAQHVADSLGPWVDNLLILDGGPCEVGVESTVVDVTGEVPRVLRPGMVTLALLHQAMGDVRTGSDTTGPARSPGQMLRHYAPRKPVVIVPCDALSPNRRDGFLRLSGQGKQTPDTIVFMPCDAAGYAQQLYASLRLLDESNVERIVIEAPPHTPEWEAIHDRLRRAATPKSKEEAP